MKYEIVNHGIWHEDHFNGCSSDYTEFDFCVTGIGDNAVEAYNDAVENIFLNHSMNDSVKISLPIHPKKWGINKKNRVKNCHSEAHYYYVSIRYSLD